MSEFSVKVSAEYLHAAEIIGIDHITQIAALGCLFSAAYYHIKVFVVVLQCDLGVLTGLVVQREVEGMSVIGIQLVTLASKPYFRLHKPERFSEPAF